MDHEDDWLHESLQDHAALTRLPAVIEFARLRCSSTENLIDSLACEADPADYSIVKVLRERDLTPKDRTRLAGRVSEVLSDDFRARLSPRLRSRIGRLLPHVATMMHEADTRELAHRQLSHRLATVRVGGLKALQRIGPKPADRDVLRQVLIDYESVDAIYLLSKIPHGLDGFECCRLLSLADPPWREWRDSYLGAVALARFAQDGSLDRVHAVHAHPVEFVRAVGRLGDGALVGDVLVCVEQGSGEVLSMAASVAGRLQSVELLKAVEQRYAALASPKS